MSRSFRRSNPITIILAGILCIGFFVFFFSGTDVPSITRKGGGEVASNPLSPPSLPFRKSKANAPQAAPPVVHDEDVDPSRVVLREHGLERHTTSSHWAS